MKSILIVDDDVHMRELIREVLSCEYKTECASNGKQATEILKRDAFDLVITDLIMPEMNGIDLLKKLKQTRPTQKVIAISAGVGISGYFDFLPLAKLSGATQILRKPFKIQDLYESVNQLLECS